MKTKTEKDGLKGRTFMLVGRKGLCKNNGKFQKHNIESIEILIEIDLQEDSKFFHAGKLFLNEHLINFVLKKHQVSWI